MELSSYSQISEKRCLYDFNEDITFKHVQKQREIPPFEPKYILRPILKHLLSFCIISILIFHLFMMVVYVLSGLPINGSMCISDNTDKDSILRRNYNKSRIIDDPLGPMIRYIYCNVYYIRMTEYLFDENDEKLNFYRNEDFYLSIFELMWSNLIILHAFIIVAAFFIPLVSMMYYQFKVEEYEKSQIDDRLREEDINEFIQKRREMFFAANSIPINSSNPRTRTYEIEEEEEDDDPFEKET